MENSNDSSNLESIDCGKQDCQSCPEGTNCNLLERAVSKEVASSMVAIGPFLDTYDKNEIAWHVLTMQARQIKAFDIERQLLELRRHLNSCIMRSCGYGD